MKQVLCVKGMMCAGCVKRVKTALENAGAKDVLVSLPDSAEFDDDGKGVAVFVEAVEDIGYDAQSK